MPLLFRKCETAEINLYVIIFYFVVHSAFKVHIVLLMVLCVHDISLNNCHLFISVSKINSKSNW